MESSVPFTSSVATVSLRIVTILSIVVQMPPSFFAANRQRQFRGMHSLDALNGLRVATSGNNGTPKSRFDKVLAAAEAFAIAFAFPA